MTCDESKDSVDERCGKTTESVAETDDIVTEVHSEGEEFDEEISCGSTCKGMSLSIPPLAIVGLLPKNKGA